MTMLGAGAAAKLCRLEVCMFFTILFLLSVIGDLKRSPVTAAASREIGIEEEVVFSKDNNNQVINRTHSSLLMRKLLLLPTPTPTPTPTPGLKGIDDGESGISTSPSCTKDDIVIYQGPTSPLPNGIPRYTVEILNACVDDECSMCDIHVSCGWFSSAMLVDPNIFRRLCYDDCLVNDGDPLSPGESLSFQYANTFRYPLSASSVVVCC